MKFFIEIVISGILSGLMYSLVALGFVLIYKASGVFNFAQGAMVYAAALAVVGFIDYGMPMWLAIIAAFVFMVIVGILTEKFVLGKLVNQPPITLFMATIGLSFFLDGLSPILFGSEVRPINLGIVDEPIQTIMDLTGIGISKLDLFSSGIIILLVIILALLFQYTKVGRALRAVADDHQAALSLGIPLENIWAIVWSIAGFVALVAGLLWGSRNGVQFALSLTALKALPVLILGGFTSVPGAIVGGIILLMTVALWALSSFPLPPEGATGAPIQYSIAGMLGHALSIVFAPIGFNWQISIALVPGMAAREVVVSSLATVYALSSTGADAASALVPLISSTWSLATALSLLAWFVFAPQCLSTIATVKRETGGWRIPIIMLSYLFFLAYLASFITYRIALFFGLG